MNFIIDVIFNIIKNKLSRTSDYRGKQKILHIQEVKIQYVMNLILITLSNQMPILNADIGKKQYFKKS